MTHYYRGNPHIYSRSDTLHTRTLYCSNCKFHAPFRKEKTRVTEETVTYRYTCPECGYEIERSYPRKVGMGNQ